MSTHKPCNNTKFLRQKVGESFAIFPNAINGLANKWIILIDLYKCTFLNEQIFLEFG
jgi:hypothetical protein